VFAAAPLEGEEAADGGADAHYLALHVSSPVVLAVVYCPLHTAAKRIRKSSAASPGPVFIRRVNTRKITEDSPITMMATTELVILMSWFSLRSTPGGVGPHAPEFDIVRAGKPESVPACVEVSARHTVL
jgi:hypothetical protein